MSAHTETTAAPATERQQATVERIRRHHSVLARTVADHTLTIRRSVERLASPVGTQTALVRFCAEELLPHAAAEEETLYRAAAELPEARLLVQAMTEEHGLLQGLVATLEAARTPAEAVAASAALDALFQAHLGKENELLLPALVAAGVDVEPLAAGIHALVGGSAEPAGQGHECTCGEHGHGHGQQGEADAAAAAVTGVTGVTGGELDVRPLPPAQRHEQIFAAFRALPTGTAFVLINDHDPKPLAYQFAAEHAGEFQWDYLEAGPEVWRVRIGRP